MKSLRRPGTILAATAAVSLGLAACGNGDGDNGGDDNGDNGDGEETGTVSIGIHGGWDEGIAASALWKYILEEEGYDVETQVADPGPIFTGLAEGDFDVNFDTWLPLTHEDYEDEFGDQWEEIAQWYDEAPLTIAVNDDAPIESLDELADNADVFDNRIVGIDSGAGLTQTTEDSVIPEYGLEDMEFVISSTPSMLAELDGAMSSGDDIVVTLWKPHWAYDEYDIRDLEDPENALGDPDDIFVMANEDFSDELPTAAGWMENFKMDDDQLFSLENLMFNERDGEDEDEQQEAVAEWVEDNPDFIPDLKGE